MLPIKLFPVLAHAKTDSSVRGASRYIHAYCAIYCVMDIILIKLFCSSWSWWNKAFLLGLLLSSMALVSWILLTPEDCGNSYYHCGVFGMRKRYTNFPPHWKSGYHWRISENSVQWDVTLFFLSKDINVNKVTCRNFLL